MQELKCYETKSFNTVTFCDYWDLKEHPLFILVDKKLGIPYLRFDEEYFDNSIKVNSLTEVRRALDKSPWSSEQRYLKHINRVIQGMINIPWTKI